MAHYLWIKNIYGQTNKSNWNHFSHIYFVLSNNDTTLYRSVYDLICTPLQSSFNYFLHFMHRIYPHIRPYFIINVSFIYSTKIILINIIKRVVTDIQRSFFTWKRQAYTSLLLLFSSRFLLLLLFIFPIFVCFSSIYIFFSMKKLRPLE